MSQFDDIMSGVGMPTLRRMFGDACTYTQVGGSPIETWCIVREAADLIGEYGERLERRTVAQLPVSAVSTPRPGDTLVTKGRTYRIDQVVGSDDLFVEVAIR